MNRPLDIPRSLISVDLAREPAFSIGALRICPPQRQILSNGQQQTVQPRVMQVLVALARADGLVLSREQLIESCWDGVVVGDDAINRCIAKVRQIADFGGGGHFEIETIPRVGYRLKPAATPHTPQPVNTEEPSLSPAPATVAARGLQRIQHKWVVFSLAGLLSIVAAALTTFIWPPGNTEISVAIEASGAPLPGSVAAELTILASAHGALSFSDGQGNNHPDFVLKLRGQRLGTRMQGDAALTKSDAADLLWSSSFAVADPDTLRERITYAVFQVLACAAGATDNLHTLGGSQLRLLFAACDRLDQQMQDPDEQAVELWRKVAQANPGDSHTLSMLAFIEAESADQSNPDIPLVLARRGTAWRHLQAARRINNELALTYAAEAVLLPRWRYDERFAVLDHGQKLDPGSAILYWVRSQTQADVGRLDGGVASARRAVEIDPGSVLYRGQLIMALMYGGYAGSAAAELKEAERIWPASLTTNEIRARFDLRFGDPKELLRKLESGITIPNMSGRWASRFAYNFLLARAQPTPEHAEAAIRDVLRASEEEVWPRVLNLADLGAVDQAYKLLQNPARLRELRHNGSDILFRADTRSLRLDRRFMQLADKLGLANFWQSNDYWPDFCYDKDLPYDCKTEARRLRARPS